MNGLLCALMIAGKCIEYFPAGTKNAGLLYATIFVGCSETNQFALTARSKKPPHKWIGGYNGSGSIPDVVPRRIKKLLPYKCGAEGSVAFTPGELSADRERRRREAISPLERYNEDAGKP